MIRSRDTLFGNSQELNIAAPSLSSYQCFTPSAAPTVPYPLPTTACQNPLYSFGFTGSNSSGTHTRAIGTGEMVSAVTSITDGLGYAFWGLGSFIGKTGIKYFTLDGVDPLYATYSDGTFPASCSGIGTASLACLHSGSGSWPLPNFSNILNGGYRAWSILRAVRDKTAPTYQQTTLTGAINNRQVDPGPPRIKHSSPAPSRRAFQTSFRTSSATPARRKQPVQLLHSRSICLCSGRTLDSRVSSRTTESC